MYLFSITVCSLGVKSRNSHSLGPDNLGENLEEDERSSKPVLVIPFDINLDPVVGLLSEQKVCLHVLKVLDSVFTILYLYNSQPILKKN